MNTKPLIKASTFALLLAFGSTANMAFSADDMTDKSNATNSTQSLDSSGVQAETPMSDSSNKQSGNQSNDQSSLDQTSGNQSSGNQADSGSGSAQVTNDWMKPLAAEFAKLDKSGNGLVLRNEASRGKAFNKKTFDQADTNNDNSLDQNEYVTFKGGDTSELMNTSSRASESSLNDTAVNNVSDSNATTSNVSNMQMTENTTSQNSTDAAMKRDATTSQDSTSQKSTNQDMRATEGNTPTSDRPVGAVVDDSMITTKAKAQILATEDLKTLDISVKTMNGEVTLTGMAETQAAKMKAEDVVKNLAGVKSVVNNLQVKG